mmetsp:Transcript_59088/g.105047  ORF Transcript_59088/g.105047 Transcript_59088/m.105047 type:complete len:200 (-) Transcript_59088:241-840(-)|eukprot:CAMPEP_0197648434 /NCGR_PEP_ID=MMETSP1338-20131121/27748_1 /TAXON_ID=43686 ORGANISM="Pelagodinium beii, Strain RCC1491" /NCGR_SAMPLE_ID=MMETSP1338 /ASSEMBLY_ACC=CAM_ASM_000754 /LENGTH=199 /DNA_ID=CAMNT_0043222425 /DNA_START=48 /DNA_END=647 /DNA_ORIENTATION=-
MASRRSGRILIVGAAIYLAFQTLLAPLAFAQAGRREVLAASAALFAAQAAPALAAVTPCKEGANNCFSTASSDKSKMAPWKWPADKSRADAIAELRSTIEAYPKEGQDGVDQGGWSFADDKLSSAGYARVEFRSGIGNFARFFNGGQPFVDDFEVSVGDDQVAVRSASRVGDSDLGVNTKRINYIAKGLRAKGWNAPGL